MKEFEYVTSDSFSSAAKFLADDSTAGATLVKAGGVDVVDRLKEGLDSPKRLLNLRSLRGKSDPIREDDGAGEIAIDALASLAEAASHEAVQQKLPALAEAAGHAATPQIRNVATVGGNLCQKPRCWYYRSADFKCLKNGGSTCYSIEGDNRYHAIVGAGVCHIVHPSNIAPALLAYGGRLRIVRHSAGKLTERVVELDDFFRVPPNPQDDENVLVSGELIREIIVPAKTPARSGYVELREKQSFDWPLVSCAVDLSNAEKPRVVLGAVAPIPWRLKPVERLLTGAEIDEPLIEKAGAAAMRDLTPMSGNAYKVKLVGVAVERAIRQACGLS